MNSSGHWVWVLFLSLCIALPDAAWSAPDARVSLLIQYRSIRDRLSDNAFGVPVYVRSAERDDLLSAEVYGIVDRPFGTLKASLADPDNWCKFVPLNPNIKSCTYRRGHERTWLTLYVGRKFYQPPARAYQVAYRYQVQDAQAGYLAVSLAAEEGPLGTSDYRIRLEAIPVGHATLVRMRLSYRRSLRSRWATAAYLATLGRDKMGFSIVRVDESGRPVYVKGVRGIIERNTMRYYLALEAYMDTRQLTDGNRFEARIDRWYDLTERYRIQLHEMERDEYLQAKRREWGNQLKLQRVRSASL